MPQRQAALTRRSDDGRARGPPAGYVQGVRGRQAEKCARPPPAGRAPASCRPPPATSQRPPPRRPIGAAPAGNAGRPSRAPRRASRRPPSPLVDTRSNDAGGGLVVRKSRSWARPPPPRASPATVGGGGTHTRNSSGKNQHSHAGGWVGRHHRQTLQAAVRDGRRGKGWGGGKGRTTTTVDDSPARSAPT